MTKALPAANPTWVHLGLRDVGERAAAHRGLRTMRFVRGFHLDDLSTYAVTSPFKKSIYYDTFMPNSFDSAG